MHLIYILLLEAVCIALICVRSKYHNFEVKTIERSAKVSAPGLVNLIPAVAYHFCLNLPAAFTKPGA